MFESSRDIIERAITQYSPYAIVSMISGGKDSLAAYLVAKELATPITHILHGVTGTGIKETTDFVRTFAEGEPVTYIEANAGNRYENYVRRKGFFGVGEKAHGFAYHVLKRECFSTALSRHIRQRKHGRPILLLNGARITESTRRARNLNNPIRADGNNIWVNVCHDWSKEQRDDYLDRVNAPVNPVTVKLCRSGECLCGTMQSKATREEVSFYFPEWGQWLDELEASAKARFGFGWGELMPSWVKLEAAGQMRLFQPMCIDCLDEMEVQP